MDHNGRDSRQRKFGPSAPKPDHPLESHMLVLAHRGCHDEVPENTMQAFAAAAASGVDGIETDVRVSADGFAVLIHDRVLAGRPVTALTRAEIKDCIGHEVPTLDDALLAFPDLYWNVEIKTRAAIEPTMSALGRYPPARALVTSFRHDAAAEIATRMDVDCGFLIADRPLSLQGLVDSALPLRRLRTIVCDFEILDGDLVKTAHLAGWRVFAYGLRTRDEHIACRAMQLDGMITDHVHFGLEVRS
jgi:glycerophosphoryl diester phosphodiesterase